MDAKLAVAQGEPEPSLNGTLMEYLLQSPEPLFFGPMQELETHMILGPSEQKNPKQIYLLGKNKCIGHCLK